MTPTPPALRPSDGHWLYGCTAAPGYIQENAHRIPPQDTEYTDAGKVAHACGEAYITGRKSNVRKIAEQTKLSVEFVKAHLPEAKRHARAYAEFVEQFKLQALRVCERAGTDTVDEWGVEQAVDRFYQPGHPAIVDFYALTSRRVVVVDLKYGQGVAVTAHHNKQIAIYARGLIEQKYLLAPDELEVEMHIWQPRIMDGEKHTVWRTTWGELRSFTDDEIGSPAETILTGSPVQFHESDKTCKFCPMRKLGCKHIQQNRLSELPELTDLIEGGTPAVDDTDAETLARFVLNGPKAIKWIEDRIDHANAVVQAGTKLPGVKLVLSKGGNRTWVDQQAAARLLRQKFKPTILWKKTLVTPKQALDALEAAHVDPEYLASVQALMIKPAGQPVLAPESDKRPEYQAPTINPADELPDLTEEIEWV